MHSQSGSGRPTLGQRVEAARRRSFVGRDGERELFRGALAQEELPFVHLYIHGPAGIGKTSLLREFAAIAADAGTTPVAIDARDIEPTPDSFLRALSQALDLGPDETPVDALARRGGRHVVLVDTCERVAPLQPWIHARFLPSLPEDTLLVMAGRDAPAPQWRTDLGVRELSRVIALRNLRPEESRAFLIHRRVPEVHHEPALRATHGHPLALALVADLMDQPDGTAARFAPHAAPEMVGILLERFLDQVPTPLHREALEICAHVRATSESLLRELFGDSDAHRLFDWLRRLSFIEQGPTGVFPHDLVRDVLEADLRWRKPDAYTAMHRRIRSCLVKTLDGTAGAERLHVFYNIVYLHRNSPFMKPFFDFAALGTLYTESAGAAEHAAIRAMVERHEGRASAHIVDYWLARQPEAFFVVRGATLEPLGFVAHLTLAERREEDARRDPAIDAVWSSVSRRGGLRPGEVVQVERFLMAGDGYQEPSAIVNAMQLACTMHWLTTPQVAWTFICHAEPERWRPLMSYIDFQRADGSDFTVAPRTYGMYGHDWRATPPAVWLEVTGERELADDLTLAALEAGREAPVLVLSQPEFDEAVKRALRACRHPDALSDNPLLRSRLVHDVAGDQPRALKLTALLRQAAEALRTHPKDEKFHRAVHATFFGHDATQELVAERLGLPFGTYRYHLNTGVERICAWLWQRELHGVSPE